MSVQIFLQGKILGIDRFIGSGDGGAAGRASWVSLLSEVLPRAVLAELGLSRLLLGASGGGEFFIVLPREARERVEALLLEAAGHIAAVSEEAVRLVWASTENLGDWSVVRKRLFEEMSSRINAPAAAEPAIFRPFKPGSGAFVHYFEELPARLRGAQSVGWSPDAPGLIEIGGGKHSWPLGPGPEAVPMARHTAPGTEGNSPAGLRDLAGRAKGRAAWGVLRGDVDHFDERVRRAQTVEEYIQLCHMYKQFFAAELEMLCSQPEFWQRVSILNTGRDDFGVYGAWDALVAVAPEIQRLFTRFTEAALTGHTGPEGKTITMALALAPAADASLAFVYTDAARKLEIAKSSSRDAIYLFGRTIEWKHLSAAAESKNKMTRLVRDFACPPQFLLELASFYRDSSQYGGARQRGRRNDRVERPWRFHRRLNRVMHAGRAGVRNKEFQKSRADLISDFTGRNAAQVRLRPEGRVALEWARLETEDTNG